MNIRTRLILSLVVAAGAVHAADPDDLARLRATLACEECDLRRADLKQADLAGARLAGASLRIRSSRKRLLKGADLTGADLRRAELEKADLSGVRASRAILLGADAEKASFVDADLTGAKFADAELEHADLSGARLDEPICGARTSNGRISTASRPPRRISGKPISNVRVSGTRGSAAPICAARACHGRRWWAHTCRAPN